jgi:hypothetical protein
LVVSWKDSHRGVSPNQDNTGCGGRPGEIKEVEEGIPFEEIVKQLEEIDRKTAQGLK